MRGLWLRRKVQKKQIIAPLLSGIPRESGTGSGLSGPRKIYSGAKLQGNLNEISGVNHIRVNKCASMLIRYNSDKLTGQELPGYIIEHIE
jgi:hypothetical protein